MSTLRNSRCNIYWVRVISCVCIHALTDGGSAGGIYWWVSSLIGSAGLDFSRTSSSGQQDRRRNHVHICQAALVGVFLWWALLDLIVASFLDIVVGSFRCFICICFRHLSIFVWSGGMEWWRLACPRVWRAGWTSAARSRYKSVQTTLSLQRPEAGKCSPIILLVPLFTTLSCKVKIFNPFIALGTNKQQTL